MCINKNIFFIAVIEYAVSRGQDNLISIDFSLNWIGNTS